MSTRKMVLQAVRTWLKAGASLTDAQVVIAPFNDVRPIKDYLTVKIISHAVSPVEETVNTLGVLSVRSVQYDTVSIQGYGNTEVWFEKARLSLRLPSGLAAMESSGVSINVIGPVSDISELVGASYETRYSQDVRVNYSIKSITEAGIALNEIAATFTGSGDQPDITINIGKTGIA